MKRLLVASLLAVLAAPAFAVIGAMDDVPAATLLLPYFEVDLDNPGGVTTLMSVNNASASAVLAHVVMWTDLSVHVLDFDIYLTGYDVQTMNLRDIIINGVLPVTADEPNDPDDIISPQGPASDDISYTPHCNESLPYAVPALTLDFRQNHLQPALTGGPSTYSVPSGLCSAINHDDRIARGYVTVDTVNDCSTTFPGDPNYFQDGGVGGLATNQNVLWGDYFYVNPDQNFAQGETLVHIEASAASTQGGLGVNNYTFYYRYSLAPLNCASNLFPGCDNREGLGNVFAARYANGGGFSGGTDFLVWRDAKEILDFFDCSDPYQIPGPFPLGANQVVLFDEEENFETPQGCTISPCPPTVGLTPFPWETQRTHVGGADLPASFDFGWAYLNLNFDTGRVSWPNPVYVMQNWVSVVMDADGRYSVGYDAVQLGNVTDPATAPDDCIEDGGPVPCLVD